MTRRELTPRETKWLAEQWTAQKKRGKFPIVPVFLHPAADGAWRVSRGPEVLCVHSRDPEHDACRALLAQGITGTLRSTRHTLMNGPSIEMDIEWGARHSARTVELTDEEFAAAMARARAFIDGDGPASGAGRDVGEG